MFPQKSPFCPLFGPFYPHFVSQSALRAAGASRYPAPKFPRVNEHTPAHRRSARATRGLASHTKLPKMVGAVPTYISLRQDRRSLASVSKSWSVPQQGAGMGVFARIAVVLDERWTDTSFWLVKVCSRRSRSNSPRRWTSEDHGHTFGTATMRDAGFFDEYCNACRRFLRSPRSPSARSLWHSRAFALGVRWRREE